MLRLILAAVGVTAAIILAPTVDAQPAFCDQHGTGPGQIYIHACAVGGGNGGWAFHIEYDKAGKIHIVKDGQHLPDDDLP